MATVTITSSQNLTSVTYAADDDLVLNPGVTLTITATPANRIKSITALFPTAKLQVTNTSTVNMLRLGFTPNNIGTAYLALRFENGAVCQMDGDYIQIYTGTGAANQTILANLNSVAGALLDYLPHVEVETGSGTGVYKKWIVMPKAVTNFHRSPYGFNSRNYTTGTVAVSSGGVVTGVGTGWTTALTNKRFRATGHTQDYIVSAFTSATSITIVNPDGTTYTGPTIGAGTAYEIKVGAAYDVSELGSGAESGTALWYDPLTSAITCGDGTNGLVIPNGSKVRIPNIFVTADTPSTTLAAAVTATSGVNITLTNGAEFPTNAGAYTDAGAPVGSLLIIDSTSGEAERIGYTSRTTNTINVAGMVRGAYFTPARTHANGSTVYFIAANNHYTSASMRLQTGGSLICKNVIFGNRFALVYTNNASGFLSAKSLYFENCGICANIASQTNGCTDSFTIKNSVLNRPPNCVTGSINGSQYAISNHTGDIKINDVFVNADYSRQSQNAITVGLGISQCPNISEFTNIKAWSHRLQNGTNRTLSVTNLKGISVDNIYSTQVFEITSCSDCTFSNLYFANGCLDPNFGNLGPGGLSVGDQCIGNVFRGIKNYDNLRPPRSELVVTANGSSDNVFQNKTVSVDLKNWGSSTFLDNQGKDNTFAYFTLTNGRSANPITLNNVNTGTRLIKMRFVSYASPLLASTGPYIPYAGYVDNIMGPQPNLGTQSNFDVQPFTVMDDSLTATGGYLVCGPFLPEDSFSAYISGLSTTAYLTGLNELYITTSGDQPIISSVYPMKGISQFDTSGTITYIGTSATTGLTYEFRMVNWGDDITLAAWQALTLANLETTRSGLTGYSSSVGLDIEIRITATTTLATRRIQGVRMPLILDTSYTPAVGSFDLNVTGVLTSSLVAVSTDGGTTWPAAYKKQATGSTVTIPIDCDFTGSTTNLKVRIRKAGYQVLEYDLSTVDVDVDLPIEQVQVVDIEGVAVYGRGGGTTSSYVTFDPANLRVDIGNIKVIGEDLYDTIAAYQATAAGIAYPEILQFDGTDTIILNTWKLRRLTAGSTNAMVDVAVIYGPNTAINPVDEVNGSVQMFPRTVRQGSLGAIAATIWDYQTSAATTSGSMGERLKDASTVATTGQQLTAALS